MTDTNRRLFLGALTLGAGGLALSNAFAAADGHAAGYDVAPAANFMPLIPRKSGEPVRFTAALDKGPLKATSGGWARDTTTRQLPLATDIAGAHLFINPGGAREMHWHNSAEWGFVLGGQCQVTVLDPAGEVEVINIAAGDLWYFPRGHGHAIQTLGEEPCHAVLAFDDGLYGEHGTFGISDWMSRFEPAELAQAYGVDAAWLATIPKGETYIMQGSGHSARRCASARSSRASSGPLASLPPYGAEAAGKLRRRHGAHRHCARVSDRDNTHDRVRPAQAGRDAGAALARPCRRMALGDQGQAKVTLFGADKLMAVAELGPGESAYIPRGCGHSVNNIGVGECEIVGVLNASEYQESNLWDWVTKAPRHLLANNFGMPEERVPHFVGRRPTIVAASR